MGLEIERKWLLKKVPEFIYDNLEDYERIELQQAYLCRKPVIRIRRENNEYILTYKGDGYKVREEYNLPLNEDAFNELLPKCSGAIINKDRYIIELGGSVRAELDIFKGKYEGLILLEVEFENEKEADAFIAPEWFGIEVTGQKEYTNSFLSSEKV